MPSISHQMSGGCIFKACVLEATVPLGKETRGSYLCCSCGCVSKSGLYSFKTAAEMREKLLCLFICVPLPLGPLPHDCCILLQPTDLLSQMSTSFMTASAFGGGPFTR